MCRATADCSGARTLWTEHYRLINIGYGGERKNNEESSTILNNTTMKREPTDPCLALPFYVYLILIIPSAVKIIRVLTPTL